MTQATDEAREKRLRKKAQKRGYALKKKRSRTPGHPGYGKFMIVDKTINGAVAGNEPFPYSMDLDQVESWLEQNERR
jgi:hypothetical protein